MSPPELVAVYRFEDDTARIAAMQAASRGAGEFGVSLEPALVGTPGWWQALERGGLPRHVVDGRISRVSWGSMGDWPEVEIVTDAGERSTWTREGDLARYVEGLRVRVTWTLHPWKVVTVAGTHSRIILAVAIEASDRRSDPHAPGLAGRRPA